jgi:hypothetical protein
MAPMAPTAWRSNRRSRPRSARGLRCRPGSPCRWPQVSRGRRDGPLTVPTPRRSSRGSGFGSSRTGFAAATTPDQGYPSVSRIEIVMGTPARQRKTCLHSVRHRTGSAEQSSGHRSVSGSRSVSPRRLAFRSFRRNPPLRKTGDAGSHITGVLPSPHGQPREVRRERCCRTGDAVRDVAGQIQHHVAVGHLCQPQLADDGRRPRLQCVHVHLLARSRSSLPSATTSAGRPATPVPHRSEQVSRPPSSYPVMSILRRLSHNGAPSNGGPQVVGMRFASYHQM